MLRTSHDVHLTKDDEDDEDNRSPPFACEDEDTEPLATIVQRMSGAEGRPRSTGNCPPMTSIRWPCTPAFAET